MYLVANIWSALIYLKNLRKYSEKESINYTEFGGERANRQQTADAVIEADFNYKSGA